MWHELLSEERFTKEFFERLRNRSGKFLEKKVLRFREFETLLTDIGKIINDRPLTVVSTNPDEELPLTPSDLLCGYRTNPALPEPEEVLSQMDTSGLIIFQKRWKLQQQILNQYWTKFRKEYLGYLRTVHASNPVKNRSIKVGDVVLLDGPSASRSYWPMAVVEEIAGGEETDGRKRTRTIRLISGKKRRKAIVVKRPYQLLYPLNISNY